MADASEDVTVRNASDSDSEAGDSDTAPDYGAFLSSLSISTSALAPASGSLPKRGVKDFEPHQTDLQSSALQRSRDAMVSALSHTRVHAPKVHVYGVYDETTGLTRIAKVKGQMFTRIGRDISGGGVDLQPEEALWALERGALDIFWPQPSCDSSVLDSSTQALEDGVSERLGLPMSLQAAYAAYVGGDWGLTPEKYVVYAGLKRSGFVVLRAQGFHEVRRQRRARQESSNIGNNRSNSRKNPWEWLRSIIFDEKSTVKQQRLAAGPLVRPGMYRSYNDIYDMLRIIPIKEPIQTGSEFVPTTDQVTRSYNQTKKLNDIEAGREVDALDDEPYFDEIRTPFTTTFNIHRPLPNFRKSAPGEPAFRVCVVSARDTRMPTLDELEGLLAEQPPDPPPPHLQPTSSARGGSGNGGGGRGARGGAGVGGVYNRLKHGQRSVLLAVVDEGVVSYMRVGEAAFAAERLYERVGGGHNRGGKGGARGGRGGGRGRGRGRGRGG